MKTYNILWALLPLFVISCSNEEKSDYTPAGPVELGSITIETQMAEMVRSADGIDTEDPTMSPAATRAGHVMSVTLGDEGTYTYIYDGGRWCPEDEPAVFPDNMRQPLSMTLAPESVAVQDGTAQALINADILTWSREDQVPIHDLENVPMEHAKTLMEFDLGNISASSLEFGNTKAYNIPSSNRWQAVIEPGTASMTVTVHVNAVESSTDVLAADSPTEGGFLAGYRYSIPLVFEGNELTVGQIGVEAWTTGGAGTASAVNGLRINAEGLENGSLQYWILGSDTPQTMTFDENGQGENPSGVPAGTVWKIAVSDGTEYLIGRPETDEIDLKFTDGKLALRDAGADGFIPVGTVAELKMAAAQGGDFRQDSDIDLMGLEWTPISVAGCYDGGNFEIANLNVSLGVGNAGLFSSVGAGSTIKNVVIASVLALNGQWHAGAVCGENSGGLIENCVNKADMTDCGGPNSWGAICGQLTNNGRITGCRNEGTLTVTTEATSEIKNTTVGGICGYLDYGTVEDCVNNGNINGIPKSSGGIAGSGGRLVITGCTNNGEIILNEGSGGNAGGIIGVTWNSDPDPLITECRNTGTVRHNGSQAGGICGQLNAGAAITACVNEGTISSMNNMAGIAGQSTDATIIACYNTGTVESLNSGWAGAGGICGYHKGTITACYNTGTVTGASGVGEITGEHNQGSVSYCFWSGDLEGVPGPGETKTENAKFAEGSWPTADLDPAGGWGTVYWKSLGSFADSTYPVLVWEE